MAISAREVGFRLYLITDRKTVRSGDLFGACEQALAATSDRPGAIAIQLREKDLAAHALYELALRMRQLCTRYGAPLLVNDRIDVAIACGADGVHLPVDSFSPGQARELIGESRLIGVSTHSDAEVAQAAAGGADFVVYGPVFQPLSKPAAYGPARGGEELAAACRTAPIPLYALGGITAERVQQLGGTGLAGAAAIGAVLGAESPGEAARALLIAIETVMGARR